MPYGTTAGLTAYAALTGQTIDGATDLDVALYNGSAYIDGGSYWTRYTGEAVSVDAAFPRDVFPLPVPDRVINAAYEAAILWSTDATALSASSSGSGLIKSEKVDVIQVVYQDVDPGSDALEYAQIRYSTIEGLLAPYIRKQGSFSASAFVV